jgi:nicotinamidase-related amidase
MTTGLLTVDIQNDYFPGGKMELAEPEAAGRNAARLLAVFRVKGRPVFHVRHLSVNPGATFFLPDTEGARIHTSVAPQDGETIVEKNFPNSFRETDLEAILRRQGVTELVICGAMSHMCIDATTRAAADLGFGCTVIHDACATKDLAFADRAIPAPEVHGAFMAALGAAYAQVVSTGEFLAGFTKQKP